MSQNYWPMSGQQPSPHPGEPTPSLPKQQHTWSTGRPNNQFLSSVLGHPLGFPAFAIPGPSNPVLSGQSDPEPNNPNRNRGQGATPGPRTCQASSLLLPWFAATVYPPAPLSGAGWGSFHLTLLSVSLYSFPPATFPSAGSLLAPGVCVQSNKIKRRPLGPTKG